MRAVDHTVSLVVLLLIAIEVVAAPVPFARTSRVRTISRDSLVGTWKVHWGTVPATVTLKANGGYECLWPGARYVGSWGVDRDGRFWITESCRPESHDSWQSYAIRLTPDLTTTPSRHPDRQDDSGSFTGPVVVGATGVSIRMWRGR